MSTIKTLLVSTDSTTNAKFIIEVPKTAKIYNKTTHYCNFILIFVSAFECNYFLNYLNEKNAEIHIHGDKKIKHYIYIDAEELSSTVVAVNAKLSDSCSVNDVADPDFPW